MSEEVRENVRKKYAEAITRKQSCCGTLICDNPVTENLYKVNEVEELPEGLIKSSFGCGNPTALSNLYPGEVVLDLGSGAGLDVLLSAKRVGPYGKAYGIDMTDEMLAVAKENQVSSGINNVEFLKGHIEDIPLPDNSIDVIISNCVINLSTDKDKVLKEAFRVLKSGGRFAVSDIVITRELPGTIQKNLAAWAGCIAGAMHEKEYRDKLSAVGFTDLEIITTREYDLSDECASSFLYEMSLADRKALNGSLVSAFIRAKKPSRVFIQGTDYLIRVATTDDVPAICQLLESNGLTTDGIHENISNFYVADCNSVVGVIGLEFADDSVMLRSMAVDNDFKKCSIAKALVDHSLEYARKKGATAAYLLTNTAENFAARRGFSIILRSEIPAKLMRSSVLNAFCPASSTCMKLDL